MRRNVKIKCKVNQMNASILCEVTPSPDFESLTRCRLDAVNNHSCPLIGIADCRKECVLANGDTFDWFELNDDDIILQ